MDEPWEHYAKWKTPDTKGPYCVIPLNEKSQISRSIETESSLMVTTRGKEREGIGVWLLVEIFF